MSDKELEGWRCKIDELDHQILLLLSKRGKISTDIMRWKKAHKQSFLDNSRELEILKKLEKKAEQLNLDQSFIYELYDLILKDSKNK